MPDRDGTKSGELLIIYEGGRDFRQSMALPKFAAAHLLCAAQTLGMRAQERNVREDRGRLLIAPQASDAQRLHMLHKSIAIRCWPFGEVATVNAKAWIAVLNC